MAWSGECSEYEEGENGDETSSDLDEIPDDELIIVLRDEQDSIKEAQRLIHKEIKSIRRELKQILRQYDASQLVQQSLHNDHQADISDSGVGTPSYVSEYNMASEVTSSHGDSESGYQASVECDSDMVTRQSLDGRYRPQSTGMHEKSSRSGSVSSERSGRTTPNATRTLYEVAPQLVNSETHHDITDHTSGLNSTYEDAYIMMRRRHRQVDLPKKNGSSRETGGRWRSTQKPRERIYSIPESDPTQLVLREDLRNGQTPVQSSEDELGEYPALQANTYTHCNASETQHRDRSQSVGQIKLNSDKLSPLTLDENYPWPNRPHSATTQSTSSHKRTGRTGAQYERPTSAASSDSDQPPHLLDSCRRFPMLSSEKESRASPTFSDSSYDLQVGMDTHGFTPRGHSSPGLVQRRDYLHKDRNLQPSIDTPRHNRDSYWGEGTSQSSSSHSMYQSHDMGQGAYTDMPSGQNHSPCLKYDRTRTKFVRGSQPVMKVPELMSGVP
ncbi:uncharacterized protein [Asterias amurensis]|uniref:uncharacterized protein n=1 Tax=Asterias amurensis TaxID=7602 RepID=UPI003AB79CE7